MGVEEARVVRVTGQEHLEPLVGFYRRVWDAGATVEGVRRSRARAADQNPVSPGQPPPVFLFMQGDRAIGHLGTIPVRLWAGGAERPAHWLQGLWVLPEHRNGPVGFLLLREALAHLGTVLAVVVEEAPRRLYEALGFRMLGPIPNYLKPLRATKLARHLSLRDLGLASLPEWCLRAVELGQRAGLASIGGAALGGGIALWSRLRGSAPPPPEGVARDLGDARGLDSIWETVRGGVNAAVARDSTYLRARYAPEAGSSYHPVRIGEGARGGLAIVKEPRPSADARLKGIRLSVLSEILYDPADADAGLGAVAAAERTAAELGADALLCTASHPDLGRLLARRAFLRLPGNQHFVFRTPEADPALPRTLAGWWLTRGDSRADAGF